MKQTTLLFTIGIIMFIGFAGIMFKFYTVLDGINGRVDRHNVEYQFVLTDCYMTVYDDNRIVGTIEIEQKLDSLIMADNE